MAGRIRVPLGDENVHALPDSKYDTVHFNSNNPDRRGTDLFHNPVVYNKGVAQVHEYDPVVYVANDNNNAVVDCSGMDEAFENIIDELKADNSRRQAMITEHPQYQRGRAGKVIGFAKTAFQPGDDITEKTVAVARDHVLIWRNTGPCHIQHGDLAFFHIPDDQDPVLDYSRDDDGPIHKKTAVAVPNGFYIQKARQGKDPESIWDRDYRVSSCSAVLRCLAGTDVNPGYASDGLMV